MTVYPVVIEPHDDMFKATFPDIPEIDDCLGVGEDDAILNAVDHLQEALAFRYLDGKPMPRMSPVPRGGLGVTSLLSWSCAT